MSALFSVFGFDAEAQPPPGQVDREEEFVDITLPVAAYRQTNDGGLQVVARGVIRGVTVGLAIELAPAWSPQPIEDASVTVYWGNGSLVSIGSDSDAFVALLASEYGMPAAERMVGRVDVTLAGMDDDPSGLLTSPAKIKTFFDRGLDVDYGEVFVNIDLQVGVVEFRDKDAEYHAGVLRSLTDLGTA